MIDEGHIDRFNRKEGKAREEARRYVDLNTVEHTDARNVGAEWLCKQAIDRLDIESFLRSKGWKEESIHATLAHLIVRTVYAPSEWGAHRIMRDNSAACELYSGRQGWMPGVNALYNVPDKLFALKDELEMHLCSRTDHLFNLENRIVLFDLTNFYFEGRKAKSRKAAFGRSKEKRSDCRLLVLALCINAEGFIRYSSILEGNAADPASLPDSRGKRITLRRVQSTGDGDTYFEVISPSKALTEASMNRMWKERFEGELTKINAAIVRKGETKRYEKVVERTGRAISVTRPSPASTTSNTCVMSKSQPKWRR